MPQSYSQTLIHLVFSTKDRRPMLTREIRPELEAYLVGVIRQLDCTSIQVGAVEDHVHLLFNLSRKTALSKAASEIKSGSSKWLKTKGPAFRDFQWQAGFGAFSVSKSNLERVRAYVADQERHHQKIDFRAEFSALLKKHGVDYDPKFLWG